MTAPEIFAQYRRERASLAPPGFRLETLPGLVRLVPESDGLEGVVMFGDLAASDADRVIEEQREFFRTLGRAWEWKVYTLDQPADLTARLAARGFHAGPTEAFMVLPLASTRPAPPLGDFRVERLWRREDLAAVLAVQAAVWEEEFAWLQDSLASDLAGTPVYCAFANDLPVGTGWIEFPAGSAFAELHGGAVLPSHRSRGIYSALFEVRVAEAVRRGHRFIAVDAAPMSRPILRRKGFQFVCETTPWRMHG